MHQINNEYKNIKAYSLPRLNPKKTIELGVKGDNSEVEKGMRTLKKYLKALGLKWRDT
jgi:hypothetical protein